VLIRWLEVGSWRSVSNKGRHSRHSQHCAQLVRATPAAIVSVLRLVRYGYAQTLYVLLVGGPYSYWTLARDSAAAHTTSRDYRHDLDVSPLATRTYLTTRHRQLVC